MRLNSKVSRVPLCGNNNLVFFVFLPVIMRDNVALLCLSQTSVPASVRGTVVSLCVLLSVCMRDLSLFVCPLVVDARIPHVVASAQDP